MILSQFVQRVRDQIDDANLLKFSDQEIVRYADEQIRGLFRVHIRQNKEWSNFSLILQKEDARKLFQNTYEWRLPGWIEAVVKVYQRDSTPGTGETTFSPYVWTAPTPPTILQEIPKTDAGRRRGWSWEGRNTLRLWNWTSEAPELLIACAATPAPLFKVTIAEVPAPAVANAIFMPATPTTTQGGDLGDFGFLEEGRYTNGECSVSGTTAAADTKLGKTSRIIYSNAATIDVTTRRHALTFDAALPSSVAIGDTFESVLQIEEMHLRLLILRVVNACCIKKFNIDLQKAITPDMQAETAEYVEWAKAPRDYNGPYYYRSRTTRRGPYNPNLRWGYAQEGMG